ncbi:hypothetical protein [Oxalobacter formigenes]|uniref:Uncharacterized protein n=2 Tax=Oxalobacter formigenes TaxID=847 RepID=C3X885_OXAFO|nr:hypothetical protein [Oxalobacter formigenes]ARQ78639.1 hypothetical protein BRW84_08490 [Oxalobacter formigenes OXCC13]EEO29411.1 hypothetical protein OFBG_00439 [Oxalobacter formigenes OXCC13]MCZ4061765.1 hypothetical protein [Oxalobacter formigenes]QDX32780.1 hypothetical protein FPZ51_03860 [Oxalobacter formigenes]WAW01046.1 hypothetical protein NB644_08840 [Oxalobacter formigenes]
MNHSHNKNKKGELMRYDKPGYGDPSTWAPLFGHPNDPRNDCEEEEIRLARLTAAFTQRITNDIVKDDRTAILVADNLIRYTTDIDIVDIIRDAVRGRKEAVFNAVRDLLEESVRCMAETQAIKQMELEK